MELLSTRGGVGVDSARKELRDLKDSYRLIDDCILGQQAIKKGTTLYLPKPNSDDLSRDNQSRYNMYLSRAVFYNVTQRTLNSLVGEIFSRDPVVELPTRLQVVAEDANGAGLTLTQLAKRAVRFTLSKGRAGILADYPFVEGNVTRMDLEAGGVQPSLTIYDASNIINWRVIKHNSKLYYTLIVLKEKYDDADDGFSVERKQQTRVLRLVDGVYTVQLFRNGAPCSDIIIPTDASGSSFSHIPFSFIGSENNDDEIDPPPMLDLAQLNIGHYRNSADYEEGVYMVGQPTLVLSGLTEIWVKEIMKGQTKLGSRGGILLPQGADGKLIQMGANSAAFEAMLHKERQMVALGAKLVENKEVQRTATEANIENSNETSILADVAKNVSAAILFGIKECAKFTGEIDAEIIYELNTDFRISNLTPQERQQLMLEWQGGAITRSEYRAALRKAGIATLGDDEAMDEIEMDEDFISRDQPSSGNEDKAE